MYLLAVLHVTSEPVTSVKVPQGQGNILIAGKF